MSFCCTCCLAYCSSRFNPVIFKMPTRTPTILYLVSAPVFLKKQATGKFVKAADEQYRSTE